MPTGPSDPVEPGRSARRAWAWALAAAGLAILPLTPGLSGSRVFYIRDLSLYFWGRYLWLRRAWLSGEFPLWDPFVGGGQTAVTDALHQMFLLPSAVLRLAGGEVLGFNLWVAAPVPLAALGAWILFRRRFSAQAAAVGAVAFALGGPMYSTTNFPNMSWTVAAMPWVLAAADALADTPGVRPLGALALAVALQAFAGEPVSQVATLCLAAAFAVTVRDATALTDRLRRGAWVATGLGLGLLAAAVQLVPMADAARASDRAHALAIPLMWSLHPLALLDTVAPRLFGDYYANPSLAETPWLPLVNSGREPFFFSLYLGVPLLALAAAGVASRGAGRWAAFWTAASLAALVCAFGSYTPVYPFLRDHLPLLASFRFPAKYVVVAAMGVSALAAAGWDDLAGANERRGDRGRIAAMAVGLAFALAAAAVAGACAYATTPVAFELHAVARALGSARPIDAAAFMLSALPAHAAHLLLLSLVTAAILRAAAPGTRREALVRFALFALVAGDLVARAWPVNPVLDASRLAEPAWLAHTRVDPDARFYIGGKRDGTLVTDDLDSPRGYLSAPGLRGSASRAALSAQTAFYPSPWRSREMLSYDLTALWPKTFDGALKQFYASDASARDRFLRRTGVRFRVMPSSASGARSPVAPMPYYHESFLYDWGGWAAPRAAVVPRAVVEGRTERAIDALFQPDWSAETVIVERTPEPAGVAGPPAAAGARIVDDRANAVTVEADAGDGGGYLVLLDSYDAGWRVRVDGLAADVVRANGLFRAVHLTPGRHVVAFAFRPPLVLWSAAASAVTGVLVLALLVWPLRRRDGRIEAEHVVSPGVGGTAPHEGQAPAVSGESLGHVEVTRPFLADHHVARP